MDFGDFSQLILLFSIIFFSMSLVYSLAVQMATNKQKSSALHEFKKQNAELLSVSSVIDGIDLTSLSQKNRDLIKRFSSSLKLKKSSSVLTTGLIKPYSLQAMLKEVVDGLSFSRNRESMKTSWTIDPGLEIVCDRDAAVTTISNLVNNALNASYPSRPNTRSQVVITALEDHRFAYVVVSNEGRIESPEIAKKIGFSRSKSTGLGMDIIEKSSKSLGGNVTFLVTESHVIATLKLVKQQGARICAQSC